MCRLHQHIIYNRQCYTLFPAQELIHNQHVQFFYILLKYKLIFLILAKVTRGLIFKKSYDEFMIINSLQQSYD